MKVDSVLDIFSLLLFITFSCAALTMPFKSFFQSRQSDLFIHMVIRLVPKHSCSSNPLIIACYYTTILLRCRRAHVPAWLGKLEHAWQVVNLELELYLGSNLWCLRSETMQGQRSLHIESPFSFIFAFFSVFLFQYIYILTRNKGILEFPFFSLTFVRVQWCLCFCPYIFMFDQNCSRIYIVAFSQMCNEVFLHNDFWIM